LEERASIQLTGTRTKGGTVPAPTITQYFSQDHDQLDDMFNTFRTEKYRNYDKAKEAFNRFKKAWSDTSCEKRSCCSHCGRRRPA
jgi:hypothetical protein